MKITNKQIIKTKIINEPIDRVWWKWTTHEGLLTFFGRDNKIELTPGGTFEIYFLMDNAYGLRGSEGCKILSFVPNEMLSFTWNSPPHFKEARKSDYYTWVVIYFNAASDHQTEVTLKHLGWPEDKAWGPVFDYFDDAWQSVIDLLDQSSKK